MVVGEWLGEFVTDGGRGIDQGDREDVVVTLEEGWVDAEYY